MLPVLVFGVFCDGEGHDECDERGDGMLPDFQREGDSARFPKGICAVGRFSKGVARSFFVCFVMGRGSTSVMKGGRNAARFSLGRDSARFSVPI